MSDKNLESFKAGAKHPLGVRKGGKPAAGAAATKTDEAPTLGFARIEKILDNELATDVQQSLGAVADALDNISNSPAAAKEKANARKAKVAVTRTVELLAFLFATKQQLMDNYVAGQSNAAASAGSDRQSSKKGAR